MIINLPVCTVPKMVPKIINPSVIKSTVNLNSDVDSIIEDSVRQKYEKLIDEKYNVLYHRPATIPGTQTFRLQDDEGNYLILTVPLDEFKYSEQWEKFYTSKKRQKIKFNLFLNLQKKNHNLSGIYSGNEELLKIIKVVPVIEANKDYVITEDSNDIISEPINMRKLLVNRDLRKLINGIAELLLFFHTIPDFSISNYCKSNLVNSEIEYKSIIKECIPVPGDTLEIFVNEDREVIDLEKTVKWYSDILKGEDYNFLLKKIEAYKKRDISDEICVKSFGSLSPSSFNYDANLKEISTEIQAKAFEFKNIYGDFLNINNEDSNKNQNFSYDILIKIVDVYNKISEEKGSPNKIDKSKLKLFFEIKEICLGKIKGEKKFRRYDKSYILDSKLKYYKEEVKNNLKDIEKAFSLEN